MRRAEGGIPYFIINEHAVTTEILMRCEGRHSLAMETGR